MQNEQIYTTFALDNGSWAQRVYAPKSLVDIIENHGGKRRIGLRPKVYEFAEWELVPEGRHIHGTMLSLGDNAILEADDMPPVEIVAAATPTRRGPMFAFIPAPKTPQHLRAVKVTQSEALAQRVAGQTRGEVLKVLDLDEMMALQRIELARQNANKVFIDPTAGPRPPKPELGYVCKECKAWAKQDEWKETEVPCEDCGDHPAKQCPHCEEVFDETWHDFELVAKPEVA